MSGLFKNKNVLITGASSGIGLATAEEFIKEGAFVTLIDYSEDLTNIANKLKCKYLK
ncbi:MAG TPA: short-chain dehydrogenase, partial [Phycisphaerales bacterium]|nr:short-chain dehydrogenase [Phycisphaerales bacterium]